MRTSFIVAAAFGVGLASQAAQAQGSTDRDWKRYVVDVGLGVGNRSIANSSDGHFVKALHAEAGVRLNDRFGLNYQFRQGLMTAGEKLTFHFGTVDWYPFYETAPNVRISGGAGIGSVNVTPFVNGFDYRGVSGSSVPALSLSATMDRYGETFAISPFINFSQTLGKLSARNCQRAVDPNQIVFLTNCTDSKVSGIGLFYVGVALGLR